MDSALQTFTFAGTHKVRTVIEDGVIEFCAKDVCNALGYTDDKKALSAHCKGVAIYHPLQTAGGLQGFRFINEADLYRLVLRSHLESSVQFQDWIVEEVLPTLRKTGTYTTPAQTFALPQTFAEALYAMAKQVEANEALKLTVAAQQPAVEFVDRYVHAEGLFGIRETAKLLGITQHEFTSLCQRHRVLFREGGTLQPYAEHLKAGYFQVKAGEANDHAYAQTRFTPKGIEWVRRKLPLQQAATLQLTA
jgi:prophage antirepressor-like protein